MSEALPDVNLAHKAEVERKLNIGKEKKAAADECFKGGDIKGALRNYHEVILNIPALSYNHLTSRPFVTGWIAMMLQSLLYLQGLDKNAMSAIAGSSAEPGKDKKTESDMMIEKIHGNICACHIKNGNWKRAEEAANQVLKKNPDNQKAKLRKAKALSGLGFAEKAVAILEELHTADPNDAEITRELAKAKEADRAATAKGFKKFKGFLSKSSGAEAVAMDESSDTEDADDVEEVTTKLEESRIEEVGA